jgi:hypothetical protein
MTDLRNKIADIIATDIMDFEIAYDATDAILAIPEVAASQARIAELEAVVAWYGEQVYIYANDTTERATEADVALDQDGGKRARAAFGNGA